MLIKKLRCCFYLFLLIVQQTAQAQNPVNLSDPDSLKLPGDYNQLIPKDLSAIVDANIVLKNGLNGFMRDHLYYAMNFDFAIFPANGSSYYMNEAYRNKKENYDYESDFQLLKKLFFQNKSFYETLYSACMPRYQDALGQMSTYEVERLMDVLKRGLKYVKNFDAAKEQSDEKRLAEKFAQSKGKLNAFIYRRIINKELTQEECNYWLNKIYKDLSAAVKLTGRAEEDYVIDGATLTPGIYTAKKHEDVSEEYQLLQKTKEGYRFLLPENTVVLTDFMMLYGNMAVDYIEVAYPGGKKELIFFSSDTAERVSPDYVEIQSIGVYSMRGENFVAVRGNEDYIEILASLFDKELKKRRFKKIEINKKLRDVSITANFAALFFEDGSSELLYLLNEGEKMELKRQALPDSLLSFSDTYDSGYGYALATYANKASEAFFMRDNKLINFELGEKLKPSYLHRWNDFLITTTPIFPSKEGGEMKMQYQLFTFDGKLVFNDIFTALNTHDSMSFMLLRKDSNYAIFDKNLKPLSGFIYSGNLSEISKKKHSGLIVFNENVAILSKYSYKKGKKTASEAVLLDRNAKPLMNEKWPFIKIVKVADNNHFYAICNQVKFNKDETATFGKFALFDANCKQLTEFIYDQIETDYTSNSYFIASKNGQTLKLSTAGKEKL